ncbi:MAG: cupin domain-containing protein [Thermoproteota archaeon]|nr:cupin domain-containing protein [Thermoproteota archaeon]
MDKTSQRKESDSDEGKISRRDFLKYVGATGALLGMSALPITKIFGDITNTTNNSVQSSNTSSSSFHSSVHVFHLDSTTPQFSNSAGSQTIAASNNFPILAGWGMATFLIRLKENGVLEPHWHPNSAELSYCIKGRARMTLFPSNTDADSFTVNTFTVEPGELVFVPQGFMHNIENISNEEAKFIIAHSNEQPTTIGISGSVGSMPNRVMNKTFGINPPNTFFNGFNNNSTNDIITGLKKTTPFTTNNNNNNTPKSGINIPNMPNSYKFNVEGIPPQIQTPGGTVAKANTNSFPILNGSNLSLFTLIVKPNGVREPHWHPNASELGYVLDGLARLIVLNPGGTVDTFEVGPGDIYFVPKGFFHYIENLDSNKNMHFAIFFGSDTPGDIGISGSLSAYSNEVLSAVFNLDSSYFNKLPRVSQDVLVVSGGG